MKLVKQKYEILGTPKSLTEAWEFVEKAARNCYQSERKDNNKTAEQWCRDLLIKHPEDYECDHMSPFEFGIIYLTISAYNYRLVNGKAMFDIPSKYESNPYSRVIWDKHDTYYVTTNLRVIIENGWEDDLKYAGAPTKYHILACCFKFDTSIHVYKDLTRHRTLSWCIESTRFCRYSNAKFGNGLTFIRHPKLKPYTDAQLCIDSDGYWDESSYGKLVNPPTKDITLFLEGLHNDERIYLELLKEGWTAQDAASKLPQDTKGTVMMCGYTDKLDSMFRKRAEECTGPVLPQVGEVIKPMYMDYLTWVDAMEWTLTEVPQNYYEGMS